MGNDPPRAVCALYCSGALSCSMEDKISQVSTLLKEASEILKDQPRSTTNTSARNASNASTTAPTRSIDR